MSYPYLIPPEKRGMPYYLRGKLYRYLEEINIILNLFEGKGTPVKHIDRYYHIRVYTRLLFPEDPDLGMKTNEELKTLVLKMRAITKDKILNTNTLPTMNELLLSRLENLPLRIDLEL